MLSAKEDQLLREIIFDTETTGLDNKRGPRDRNRRRSSWINRIFRPAARCHLLRQPAGDRQVHPDALAVHGISDAVPRRTSRPSPRSWHSRFLEFFEGCQAGWPTTAASIMGFINAEFARHRVCRRSCRRPPDRTRWRWRAASTRWARTRSMRIVPALRDRQFSRRTKHGALLDSELLAEVYIELIGGRQAALGLGEFFVRQWRSATGAGRDRGRSSFCRAVSGRSRLPPRLTEEPSSPPTASMVGRSLGDKALWAKLLAPAESELSFPDDKRKRPVAWWPGVLIDDA
jgi:DNA polymerase-3 subunit epsilon